MLCAVGIQPHYVVVAQFGTRQTFALFRRSGCCAPFACANIDRIMLVCRCGYVFARIFGTPLDRIFLRYERFVQNRILHCEQFSVGSLCRYRKNRRQCCDDDGLKCCNFHQNRYFSVLTRLISEKMCRQASSPRVVPTTSITFPAVIAPIVPHCRNDNPSQSA